ncbi:MAG: diguanylate cyclase [Gallionellaceae bacterium]
MNDALAAKHLNNTDTQYLHRYAPEGLSNDLVNDQMLHLLHLEDIRRQRNKLRLERTRTDTFNPSSWLGRELASIADILEKRKHIVGELRRHKIFVATAIDGFWRTNANGVIEEVNEAYVQMSGYRMEELVGMHISQLEANEQEEDVQAHLQKLILQGHDRFESRHRRKDGKIIDVEVSTTYLYESKEIFVFCRDITQRKETEQALRVAAAAFETHDAILITDAESNIVRVNRAFTSITGYSAEEVIGKNPRVMSSGLQDKAFYAEMWQHLLDNGSWAGEIWDQRKNGEIYPKWLTISAVKDDQGKTTQYVAIFSDISARKQAEDEIRNLAFYDSLTNLPNRRLLLDRFHSALSVAARKHSYGAVLFLDLDKFKTLNDSHGHDYGDLMLVEVAQRIKSCVRKIDTVARLGGDEFVVLLEDIDKDADTASQAVSLIAEKIRSSLHVPYFLKDIEYQSSPSIGVCLYQGDEQSLDHLLKCADQAMYQAKNSGRNTVCFFDSETLCPAQTGAD